MELEINAKDMRVLSNVNESINSIVNSKIQELNSLIPSIAKDGGIQVDCDLKSVSDQYLHIVIPLLSSKLKNNGFSTSYTTSNKTLRIYW